MVSHKRMFFYDLSIHVPSRDHSVMFWDLFHPVSRDLLVEEFFIFIRATIYRTFARHDGSSWVPVKSSKHNTSVMTFFGAKWWKRFWTKKHTNSSNCCINSTCCCWASNKRSILAHRMISDFLLIFMIYTILLDADHVNAIFYLMQQVRFVFPVNWWCECWW